MIFFSFLFPSVAHAESGILGPAVGLFRRYWVQKVCNRGWKFPLLWVLVLLCSSQAHGTPQSNMRGEVQNCSEMPLRWYNHRKFPEPSTNWPHFGAAYLNCHGYGSHQQGLMEKTPAKSWFLSHCCQLRDKISYGLTWYVMRGVLLTLLMASLPITTQTMGDWKLTAASQPHIHQLTPCNRKSASRRTRPLPRGVGGW